MKTTEDTGDDEVFISKNPRRPSWFHWLLSAMWPRGAATTAARAPALRSDGGRVGRYYRRTTLPVSETLERLF